MGKARDRVVRAVRKFFFNRGIAPHEAASPYLKIMLDTVTEHGSGIKAPHHMRLATKVWKMNMKRWWPN